MRGAGLVLLTALAMVVVACGSGVDSTSSESTSPTVSPTPATSDDAPPADDDPGDPGTTVVADGDSFSVLAGEGVAVDLDDLATNLTDRLVAAGHTEAAVEVDGDRITVDPGDGPLDQLALEDLVATPGRLEMRPVREVSAPDCEASVPSGAAQVDVYPELDDTGAVAACYTLGPRGLTNDAIEDAAATLGPTFEEQWTVSPVFTPAGIDGFNLLAFSCNSASAGCPTRQVAIALDGVVVSAPTINEPSFERDQIQISGAFTEAEAKALAAALRTEPLPNGLEVVE